MENYVLHIDRTTPFNPIAFLGAGWVIMEEDEESLNLDEVDLTKVDFETALKDGEEAVVGEERLRRLKEVGCIRLDAKVLQTLLENPHHILEIRKQLTDRGITYVFFDGTILRDPYGNHCVLCLCLDDSEWSWSCPWLSDGWYASSSSAVLAH